MIHKIIKGIKRPKRAFRFFSTMVKYSFRKKKGTLVIIGLASDGVLGLIFRGYEIIYGFEPNPDRFDVLKRKYNKYDNVKLFNVVLTTYNGEIDFNISSNNNGASSSIGKFDPNWYKYKEGSVRMKKSIKVKCLNLYDFCKENNIDYIDDYISDIQGMDLTVLKTMKPMISSKKIGTIACEVTKDKYKNVYVDLPDNSEKGFQDLLDENYQLSAKGLGILSPHKFDKIPEDVWEMDCMWSLQDN